MNRNLCFLLLLILSTVSYSQTVALKGKVTDNTGIPLESATIYLTSVKDSSVVDYTISGKNGNWELKTRKLAQPVYLKISFIGLSDHRQLLENVTADRDFGTLKLEDRPTELDAVVIESEVPPIRIKKDTLEFNASSFKVRPDANVEALLKQLPGVEIDEEGKITVNGKEVNQILVNGKPFFDKDGKIALQNLPAEIIDKVQVTDTKTKEEEISGQAASSNNSSINLTIQEDKNKGLFGKFMGGYGSNERYESSALLNYFKGERKISVLASSNNINSTGFSMNEIFDNMGGGRIRSYSVSDNGAYNINGIQFGGGQGITRSNLAGINYSDQLAKGFDSTVSYFYTSAGSENDNRTVQTTLLPQEEDPDNPGSFINNNFTTQSASRSEADTYAHTINSEFEVKIDSTSRLSFTPKFIKGNNKSTVSSTQSSVDENNVLLNESTAYTFNENDNTSFKNNLYYFKSFRRKGRALSVSFNNDNNKDDGTNLNRSSTFFYTDDNNDGVFETESDIRDQVLYNRSLNDRYNLTFEYFEPVLDSVRLKIGSEYSSVLTVEDRKAYDFDASTGRYSALNDVLTQYLTQNQDNITPYVALNLEKNKINIGVELGTTVTNFRNFSSYLGVDYRLNRQFALPYARLYTSVDFSKSRSMWMSYNYSVDFPSASQVLPVEDVSNPLSTTIGNPGLEPNKNHDFYVSLRDYDFATRSGWNLYAGVNLYDKQVVATTIIDESAKRTTSYTNVSGTYSSWAGLSWNKSVKKEAHKYRYSLGLNGGLNYFKGFTNGVEYEANELRITPRANFSYEYGDLLTINPSYNFTYREQNYNNYIIDKASNIVHTLTLETTSYWPKHVVFGNDISYSYNSNIADGFRKDFLLWNSSIGYNFLKDKLLFKVKVYDLLNQNLSATRTITATSIRDEQNTVLRRYVMFSLTYKLEKFGAKERKDDGGGFWFW